MALSYCRNCGEPISPGSNFCPSCGHPVAEISPPAQQSAPPQEPEYFSAPPEEPILMTISVRYKKSTFTNDAFTLVATERRVIMAHLEDGIYKEFTKQLLANATDQGKGLFAKMGKSMGSGFAFLERYKSMPADSIIAESTGSFFIPNEQIEWIKYYEADLREDSEGNTKQEPAMIILHAAGHDYKMTINFGNNREIQGGLKQIFGDKVKVKLFG